MNPVEALIFAVVLGGFSYSVGDLFRERDTFTALFDEGESSPTGLASQDLSTRSRRAPASAQITQEAPGVDSERDPASIQSAAGSMRQFDFRCDLSGEQSVDAGKVRISGPFCPGSRGTTNESPLKTTLLNEANQFTATVFMDSSTGRFSTDYVPLGAGPNPIQIEFRYADGSAVKKSFVLLKK